MDECNTTNQPPNKSGSNRYEAKKGASGRKPKMEVGPPKESGARTSGVSAKYQQRKQVQRTHRFQEPKQPDEEKVRMAVERANDEPTEDNEAVRDRIMWQRDFRQMNTMESIKAFNGWVEDLDYATLYNIPKVRCKTCGILAHTKCYCLAQGMSQDKEYEALLENLPKTPVALVTANEWVTKAYDEGRLSAACRRYCHNCGISAMTICGCHLPKQPPAVVIKEKRLGGGMDITRAENYDLAPNWRENTTLLNTRLHLYLRSNMHVNYPSRPIKIEHLHKLRMKYYEANRIDPSNLSLAEFNRDMLTEGKAADDEANTYLLAPRVEWAGFWTTLLLFLICFTAVLLQFVTDYDPLLPGIVSLFTGVWSIKRLLPPSIGYAFTRAS